MKQYTWLFAPVAVALALAGCTSPANPGVAGSPTVSRPAIDGTVFTLVFENQDAASVLKPQYPTFYSLSQTYGRADAYISYDHPSLANYINMTSGSTHGISSSNDPATNIRIDGTDNLADQLDGAGIPWRAYQQSMGAPCGEATVYPYAANHNPFVYYTSMTNDPARCADRIVDYDAHFAEDLAADRYRFMWIKPDKCNDGHDCPLDKADAFLAGVIPQIMASPGYLRGGVIFVLFDEGYVRLAGSGADLATTVISPRLVSTPYVTSTRFDHRSYLATVEDIFGLPRLPTTVDATPMNEFFEQRNAI